MIQSKDLFYKQLQAAAGKQHEHPILMFCSKASEDDDQPPANLFDEMWHIVDRIDKLGGNEPLLRHRRAAMLFVLLVGDVLPLFH